MSQTGNYTKELTEYDKWKYFRKSVDRAKDVAVTFGLQSEEYREAISDMQIEFEIVPKTKIEKLIIWLNKRM